MTAMVTTLVVAMVMTKSLHIQDLELTHQFARPLLPLGENANSPREANQPDANRMVMKVINMTTLSK